MGSLVLERGHGDVRDVPILGALGADTSGPWYGGCSHLFVGKLMEGFVGRLTGRFEALTTRVPAHPLSSSFFGEEVNIVWFITFKTSSEPLAGSLC